MTTKRLLQAANCIAGITGNIVTSIEFVDVWADKFRYSTYIHTGSYDEAGRPSGNPEWNYEDDSPYFEITWDHICNVLGYNPDNLCTTTEAIENQEFEEAITKAFKLMERKRLKDNL